MEDKIDVQRFHQWCTATHGHELSKVDVGGEFVLAVDYDALAREVEALKAHNENGAKLFRAQVVLNDELRCSKNELERKLADTTKRLEEAETNVPQATIIMLRKGLAEAQQRIARLEAEKHYSATLDAETELLPRLQQAEERLAADDHLLEQIAEALDSLSIAGDKVNPAGRKYLTMVDQIKALRKRLAALTAALVTMSGNANFDVDGYIDQAMKEKK